MFARIVLAIVAFFVSLGLSSGSAYALNYVSWAGYGSAVPLAVLAVYSLFAFVTEGGYRISASVGYLVGTIAGFTAGFGYLVGFADHADFLVSWPAVWKLGGVLAVMTLSLVIIIIAAGLFHEIITFDIDDYG